jgi:hypothetical protein
MAKTCGGGGQEIAIVGMQEEKERKRRRMSRSQGYKGGKPFTECLTMPARTTFTCKRHMKKNERGRWSSVAVQ